jgi:hypothetical protein
VVGLVLLVLVSAPRRLLAQLRYARAAAAGGRVGVPAPTHPGVDGGAGGGTAGGVLAVGNALVAGALRAGRWMLGR